MKNETISILSVLKGSETVNGHEISIFNVAMIRRYDLDEENSENTILMITRILQVSQHYLNISRQQFPIFQDTLEKKLNKAPAVGNVVWHLDQ